MRAATLAAVSSKRELILATYYLLLTTYHLLLTTCYLLLATYYLLLTTYYLLPTTYYLLLTAYYSLLTTHCLLLTAYCLLLITHRPWNGFQGGSPALATLDRNTDGEVGTSTYYLLLATSYLLATPSREKKTEK